MSYSARIATDQQALIAMLFDASVTGQPSPSLAESRFLEGVARSINQSLRDLVLQSLRGEEIRDYFKVAMFGFGSLFEASLQVESALFAEQASRSLASISDLGNDPLESVDEPSQNTIANYIRRILRQDSLMRRAMSTKLSVSGLISSQRHSRRLWC